MVLCLKAVQHPPKGILLNSGATLVKGVMHTRLGESLTHVGLVREDMRRDIMLADILHTPWEVGGTQEYTQGADGVEGRGNGLNTMPRKSPPKGFLARCVGECRGIATF